MSTSALPHSKWHNQLAQSVVELARLQATVARAEGDGAPFGNLCSIEASMLLRLRSRCRPFSHTDNLMGKGCSIRDAYGASSCTTARCQGMMVQKRSIELRRMCSICSAHETGYCLASRGVSLILSAVMAVRCSQLQISC